MRESKNGKVVGGVIDMGRRFVRLGMASTLFFIPRLATAAETWTSSSASPYYMYPSQASTNIGIGSNVAPSFQFQLFSKAASSEANAGIQGYGNRSALYFLRADILNSAATNVANGDQVGIVESRGYSGTGYMAMSAIDFKVDGTFTAGQRPPSMIEFYTNTANGSQTTNMLIKNDGKVGIGTTTPTALLNVSTAAAVNADVNIARFGNKLSTGRTVEMSVDYRGTMGDGTLVLREDRAGVDFMTINMLSTANKVVFPNGNIGIGQTTPAAKLDVNGNLNVANRAIVTGNTSGQEALVVNQNQTGTIVDLRRAGVSKVLIDDGGNMGIGLTAPSQKLDVNGNANVKGQVILEGDAMCVGSRYGNSYNDFWRIGMDHQTDDGGILHIRTGDNSNEPIYFEQSADPGITNAANVRMAVASNGSIGIGTTSPTAYLHVSGAGVGAGMSGIDLTNTVSPGHTFKLSAGIEGVSEGGFTIMDRSAGDLSRIAIDNLGRVGIGTTSPLYTLDLYGSMRIYGNNSNDFTALSLRAGSNGGDKTRITFMGDNNGDYAEIVGTSTNPASGNGTPVGGTMVFRTRNGANSSDMRDQMTITESGKFILGGPATNLPLYELHPIDGSSGTNNGNGSSFIVAAGACDNTSTKIGGNLYLRAGGKNLNIGNYGNVAIADDGGRVGIGTDNPGADYKVDVRGNVNITGEVTVASVRTNTWSVAPPDYVFEKEYKLASLSKVEKYINEKKHLPDVPSAKEMTEKGMDLTEMNLKLLKKVEELTLYAIEQEKKDHLRDAEMAELKRTIATLKVGRK